MQASSTHPHRSVCRIAVQSPNIRSFRFFPADPPCVYPDPFDLMSMSALSHPQKHPFLLYYIMPCDAKHSFPVVQTEFRDVLSEAYLPEAYCLKCAVPHALPEAHGHLRSPSAGVMPVQTGGRHSRCISMHGDCCTHCRKPLRRRHPPSGIPSRQGAPRCQSIIPYRNRTVRILLRKTFRAAGAQTAPPRRPLTARSEQNTEALRR